jgi:hypothetical protein
MAYYISGIEKPPFGPLGQLPHGRRIGHGFGDHCAGSGINAFFHVGGIESGFG